jgi:hypothetical protein
VHGYAVRDLLPRTAVVGAAHGQHVNRVDADRDANVGAFRTPSDDWIEADPAEAGKAGLRPAVNAGMLSRVVGEQVADRDTRRNAKMVRARNEYMRDVARVPVPSGECFGGTGKLICAADDVTDPLMQCIHERVGPYERHSLFADRSIGKVAKGRVGRNQSAIAQEQIRGEAFDRVTDDSGRVERLDLTVRAYRQLGKRTFDGERIEGIAECVLAHSPATIRFNIHAPTYDMLAFMVAGLDAQMLDDGTGRRIPGPRDLMADGETHCSSQQILLRENVAELPIVLNEFGQEFVQKYP